ncbi:hypothetical protein, partial [Mesorhizobium sp.]|uniref:hypothetical protein n=1 Tax=Mesorhizobium sp. TaxID=1871066 RepID=UPI0025BABF1D
DPKIVAKRDPKIVAKRDPKIVAKRDPRIAAFVPRRRLRFAYGRSPQARLRVAGRPAPSLKLWPVRAAHA